MRMFKFSWLWHLFVRVQKLVMANKLLRGGKEVGKMEGMG